MRFTWLSPRLGTFTSPNRKRVMSHADLRQPRQAGEALDHRHDGGHRRSGWRAHDGFGRQLQFELVEQLQLELLQQLQLELLQQLELELVEPAQVREAQDEEGPARVPRSPVALPGALRRLADGRRARSVSRPRPTIEFLCRPEDKGVIAEPVAARTVQPAWFKSLPGLDRAQLSATNNGLTVKRCVPFLDALSVGWILPLAATVRLQISDGGSTVVAGWEFDREMVSTHSPHQAAGNPYEPRPMMKFHNPWTIRTPPGWSCLFVAPLNRPDAVVEVLSGVVDTDVYVSPVNFPFVAVAGDGVHILSRGTPIVQVIPFERRYGDIEAVIRAESDDEAAESERVYRSTLAAEGSYRRRSRAQR